MPGNGWKDLALLLSLVIVILAGCGQAATLTVCPSGCQFTSIQAAINAAVVGDTIEVQSGTYNENVNVNKRLMLRGIGLPVVDAGGRGSAVNLTADGCTLTGFELKNSSVWSGAGWPPSGICDESSGNAIKNNFAHDNDEGIYLRSSPPSNNNTIEGNNLSGNRAQGIYIDALASGNIIKGNTIKGNAVGGLTLSFARNNTISENTIASNSNGIFMIVGNNDNTIFLNKLISNQQNARYVDAGQSNRLNSTYKWTYIYKGHEFTNYTGNYWSDYTGVDAYQDGIGDTPYQRGSMFPERDAYPLMDQGLFLPRIEVQPMSIVRCVGQEAFFLVGAAGVEPMDYRWKKDGVPIAGSSSNLHQLLNISPGDAGSYSVNVSNAFGSTESNPANLTVSPPPAITVPPANRTVCAGQAASFSVTASGAIYYQWMKNGSPIEGATWRTYTIPRASPGDAGSYSVVVSNCCGTVKSDQATLTVDSLCPRSTVALQASSDQYLCAEGGGGREVVANRNTIGAWETFRLIDLGNGGVALQAFSGQYVCAEGGGGREVVANRNVVGSWETFRLVDLGNSSVALRAFSGQYLCAEGGGGREVVANRNAIGPWETFRLIGLP